MKIGILRALKAALNLDYKNIFIGLLITIPISLTQSFVFNEKSIKSLALIFKVNISVWLFLVAWAFIENFIDKLKKLKK